MRRLTIPFAPAVLALPAMAITPVADAAAGLTQIRLGHLFAVIALLAIISAILSATRRRKQAATLGWSEADPSRGPVADKILSTRGSTSAYRGVTEDLPWDILISEGSSDSEGSVVWRTPSAAIGGVLQFWFHATHHGLPAPGAFSIACYPIVASLGGNSGDTRDFAHVRPIHTGSELDRLYAVRGSFHLSGEHISPPLREALLWMATIARTSKRPTYVPHVIVFWRHGLSMLANGAVHSLDELQDFIGFGVRLARSLRPEQVVPAAPAAGTT